MDRKSGRGEGETGPTKELEWRSWISGGRKARRQRQPKVVSAATAWGRRHREGGSAVWRHSGGSYGCGCMLACGSGGNGNVLVVREKSGGGSGSSGNGAMDAYDDGGSNGDWTPSSTFHEQPLKREETPLFSQMAARVCREVPSPLLEPKMSQEGTGST